VFVFCKLGDSPFVGFQANLEGSESIIYLMMDAVSKHHNQAGETERLQVFVKTDTNEFKPFPDIIQKLSRISHAKDVYDWDAARLSETFLSVPVQTSSPPTLFLSSPRRTPKRKSIERGSTLDVYRYSPLDCTEAIGESVQCDTPVEIHNTSHGTPLACVR
jgi:hypothetical protein